MNKFRSIIKCLVLLLCFVGIAIIIDVVGFNYKILFLDDSEKIIRIEDYQKDIVDNNIQISFDLENSYVDKLRFVYSAERDVKFILNYQDEDYYGNLEENTINDSFDNEVAEEINNIRSKVSKVEVIYDRDSDIDIQAIMIDNQLELNVFRVFFITIILALGYILYQFYKQDNSEEKIHRYFILVGLLLGTTFIILQPSTTYYSWDDQIHFLNSYEIFDANGIWNVGEVAMIDSNPVGRDSISSIEEQRNMNVYLNVDEEGNYSSFKSRFITYNKIAYLPSAVGFHICKILNLPFVICFKVGKFMNLLSYLLIFGYAIKFSSSLKRFLVVLGLIPTNLFLATQYSYDPAVIAGITLGVTLIYEVITNKNCKVDFKFMMLFLFSMLYGCFPKAVYAPLMLMFLLIPQSKFKNKKQCNRAKIGIILVTILMMATFVLPTVSNDIAGDSRGGVTSVTEQLKLIVQNPIGYVMVLKDTMIANFFNNFIGKGAITNFAYMGSASDNLYYLYLLLLLVVGIVDNFKNDKFKIGAKGFSLILLFGIILLIWTALYLSFTPVGLTTVNGVQPRYFLPLLLPLLLCIKPKNLYFNIKSKMYHLVVLLIPVIVFLFVIFNIVLVPFCF